MLGCYRKYNQTKETGHPKDQKQNKTEKAAVLLFFVLYFIKTRPMIGSFRKKGAELNYLTVCFSARLSVCKTTKKKLSFFMRGG